MSFGSICFKLKYHDILNIDITILCLITLYTDDSNNILPSLTTVNLAEPWIFPNYLNCMTYDIRFSVWRSIHYNWNYNVKIRTLAAKFTFVCQYLLFVCCVTILFGSKINFIFFHGNSINSSKTLSKQYELKFFLFF